MIKLWCFKKVVRTALALEASSTELNQGLVPMVERLQFMRYIMKFSQTLTFALLASLSATVSYAQDVSHQVLQSRCQPGQACWPSPTTVKAYFTKYGLQGPLYIDPLKSPIAACQTDFNSSECKKELSLAHNPFYLQSIPNGSESQGYWKAWTYQNSTYTVEPDNANDVVLAVNFARQHNIRLVIKGKGHDQLGRSNAPKSLLIWTHNLKGIHYDESFIPEGSTTDKSYKAVTVGAGEGWLSVDQRMAKYGRAVLSGGCTSVGAVGGFTLGGGFGELSKAHGTGASNLLQAKIVTADGRYLTVNRFQHPAIFWAIRGGGPGFGLVTQMTYRTFKAPQYVTNLTSVIATKNYADYEQLIRHTLTFLRDHVINNSLYGIIVFKASNGQYIIYLTPGYIGTKYSDMKIWAPYFNWVQKHSVQYTLSVKPTYVTIPFNKYYNAAYVNSVTPGTYTPNTLPNAPKGQYWRASNNLLHYDYIGNQITTWPPMEMLNSKNIQSFSEAISQASVKSTDVIFELSKGLGGGSHAAIRRFKKTATNPGAADAIGFLAVGDVMQNIFPDVKGHDPKEHAQMLDKYIQNTRLAMQIINNAIVKATGKYPGAYINETTYFEKNWQQAFWGNNYLRLLRVKGVI